MKSPPIIFPVKLFNVPISIINESQALALIGEWVMEWKEGLGIEAGKSSIQTPAHFPKIITTPNPEIIVAAQNDPDLMAVLQSADLAIPDGIGIVWALRLLRISDVGYRTSESQKRRIRPSDHPKSEIRNPKQLAINNQQLTISRLSGLDLMEGMILKGYSFKDHPLKVMLVGGRPGVAQVAAAKLQAVKWLNGQMAKRSNRQNPNSTIQPFSRSTIQPFNHSTIQPFSHSTIQPFNHSAISAVSGPQDIANISKSENDRLIAQINRFSPDLLFVAFGHPKQEKWLAANRHRLTAGVAMAVGGAFDQLANPTLRPPPYINSIGLSWLYRLLRQPWRLKRQLALLKFVWMVVRKMKNLKSKM